MTGKKSENIQRIFTALGDPTRRALVERLAHGPVSVSELARLLRITLTAVGQHLAVLESAGLAISEKSGRVRICRLHTAGFDLLESWIRSHRTLWERRLDRRSQLIEDRESTR